MSKLVFLCDSCGDEKSGDVHKAYDENWNLQKGLRICSDCFTAKINDNL